MNQPLLPAQADPVGRSAPALRQAAWRSADRLEDDTQSPLPPRPRFLAPDGAPTCQAAPRSTPAELARMLHETWRLIDAAMVPLIGHGGVRALRRRSIQLTVSAHPWLAAVGADAPLGMDAQAWQAAMAAQGATEANAACATLLAAVDRLLVGLIGPSLAHRLLQPVWEVAGRRLSGRAAQAGR